MPRNIPNILALSALLATTPCGAELPRLEASLKALEQEDTFYGSVLVTQGGKPLHRADYGFADEAKTVRNGSSFVYYAPFLNEPMLAALMEMAQERGLLSLDAPIGTYLPAFKDKPSPRVRDLLYHASGFPVFKINLLPSAKPGTLALADLASGLAERPLLEEPGKRFVFMFNNLEMAGLVLETVTDSSYPALLSDWILKPLAMHQTGVGIPSIPVAWGTRLGFFQKDLALWKGNYLCSEGLYSTVEDLDRFFSALSGGRLLPAKAYQDMQTPHVKNGEDGATIAFNVTQVGALRNGGDDRSGFHAVFWFDPRYDLRILVLCNRWMDAEGRKLRSVIVPPVYADLGLKE